MKIYLNTAFKSSERRIVDADLLGSLKSGTFKVRLLDGTVIKRKNPRDVVPV